MSWSTRIRPVAVLAASALTAAALVAGLAGCTSGTKTTTTDLPPASQLLAASVVAVKDVKSVHFTLDVQGTVGDIAVHHADGVLTRSGDAKGTATVEQLGATVEVQFVVVGDKLYVKGPTGGFQQLPLSLASSVYDPSAILDPDRGMAKLLGSVSNARTEAKEQVGGKDAYRVAVTPAPGSMNALVPGLPDNVTGKIWLAADAKRPVKGEFTVPGSASDKGGTVTITFTDYDAPVTISAP
jgi:lipoprotein LprG